MSLPRSSPVAFPMFGTLSNTPTITELISERQLENFADCENYISPDGIIEQHWSSLDTVSFQINEVNNTFYVRINEDQYFSTASTNPDAPVDVRNWSIPLNAYAGQDIEMVLAFDNGFGEVIVDVSPLMRVHRANTNFLNCTRKIEYWGEGFEVGIWYSNDAANPDFTQCLRVPASLRFDNLEFSNNIVQVDRDGNCNVCFVSVNNKRVFSTTHIPLWMHETLNYVMAHRQVLIDTNRFVFDTPFRSNRQIPGTNLFTGDMIVKLAEHLYTTTRAN